MNLFGNVLGIDANEARNMSDATRSGIRESQVLEAFFFGIQSLVKAVREQIKVAAERGESEIQLMIVIAPRDTEDENIVEAVDEELYLCFYDEQKLRDRGSKLSELSCIIERRMHEILEGAGFETYIEYDSESGLICLRIGW